VSAQPSSYSESTRPAALLVEELARLTTELTAESIETLVDVARRLARLEDKGART
jgi:hypothetical protein